MNLTHRPPHPMHDVPEELEPGVPPIEPDQGTPPVPLNDPDEPAPEGLRLSAA